MRCPFCNQPAPSAHHIKPRSKGGSDDQRNIIMLCGRCHDEYEDEDITPAFIQKKRMERLGKESTKAESLVYFYRPQEGGEFLAGIAVNDHIIVPLNIFIPFDAQLSMAPAPSLAVTKKGRPRMTIPADVSQVLANPDMSVRDKAKVLGLHYQAVERRMKRLQETGVAYSSQAAVS